MTDWNAISAEWAGFLSCNILHDKNPAHSAPVCHKKAERGCQGLLQSVPSLQVSVAILYYSIVMVSLGSLSTGSPSCQFLLFR